MPKPFDAEAIGALKKSGQELFITSSSIAREAAEKIGRISYDARVEKYSGEQYWITGRLSNDAELGNWDKSFVESLGFLAQNYADYLLSNAGPDYRTGIVRPKDSDLEKKILDIKTSYGDQLGAQIVRDLFNTIEAELVQKLGIKQKAVA